MRRLLVILAFFFSGTGSAFSIEDERTIEIFSLLPMIFFCQDSGEIPVRYQLYPSSSHVEGFREDTLSSTLNAYYNYLNILGKRMRSHPETKIEIVGCRDTIEEKNSELSGIRANTIARYLVEVWGISPERLKITARGLPLEPSNIRMDQGREENRRVQIVSKSWEILKPVVAMVKWEGESPPGERYEIIRFKFDSYDMGDDNRTYLKEYILPRLTPNAKVLVYGYENFEDPEHTLGFKRAREVVKLLKSSVKFELDARDAPPIVRYSSETPEGRFYHRSVLIEILQ